MPNSLLFMSGMIAITEDGQAPVTYLAGNCFITNPGYSGNLRAIEAARKVWVTA